MPTLEEIRAKLKSMDNKNNNNANQEEEGSLVYPHWNIEEGSTVSLRFLPDKDPDNTFFWRERQQINLEFPGVVGGNTEKSVFVKVPCMEMYGESCPILNEVRPWWKDPDLEETARKYWKKRSYFLQGFVLDDTLNEKVVPENPIRKFIISPQIFNIIKAALLDPDMEYIPTDYDNGVNFQIVKASKGGFNDYSTSKYARRESSLTDEQRQAIETHGLFDLKEWLPEKPDQEAVQVISEMFEASVNGEMYDPAKWGRFYKPYGLDIGSNSASVSVPKAVNSNESEQKSEPAPEPEQKAEPVVEEQKKEEKAAAKSSGSGTSAEDILAKIRSRTAS